MARKRANDSSLDILHGFFMSQPWWVCPIFAGIFYLLARFGFPAIVGQDTLGKALGPLGPFFAPWIFGITLLIGLIANLSKAKRRGLLEQQSGLESIRKMSWKEFELLVGEAYRRQGYVVTETGGGGADGGVDLSLAANGEKLFIQCKQWRTLRVGVKPIRELFGVVTAGRAQGGIFVTSGTYTPEARNFAEGVCIELVDGHALLELVRGVQSSGRISSAPQQPAPPAPIARPEPIASASPSCPLRNTPMVLRTARKGSLSGSQFWGCTGYPKCRGTLQHS